jgi:phage tail-like protein
LSVPGLENVLDELYVYFLPQQSAALGDAGQAPADFLPWLASWVALSLRNDWDETTQRQFISQMVTLYQQRGTLAGLQKLLNLYTGLPVTIYDQFDGLPYYFEVALTMTTSDPAARARQFQIAQSLIDQEKPAHTYYTLKIYAPTMRIVNTRDADADNRLYIYPATNVRPTPGNRTIFGTAET